jgi:hypothetical protein
MTPEREERLKNVLDKRQPDLTVVLENVFDPHNISAVMRTCDAVGIQDIHILNTKISRHKKWGPGAAAATMADDPPVFRFRLMFCRAQKKISADTYHSSFFLCRIFI